MAVFLAAAGAFCAAEGAMGGHLSTAFKNGYMNSDKQDIVHSCGAAVVGAFAATAYFFAAVAAVSLGVSPLGILAGAVLIVGSAYATKSVIPEGSKEFYNNIVYPGLTGPITLAPNSLACFGVYFIRGVQEIISDIRKIFT